MAGALTEKECGTFKELKEVDLILRKQEGGYLMSTNEYKQGTNK